MIIDITLVIFIFFVGAVFSIYCANKKYFKALFALYFLYLILLFVGVLFNISFRSSQIIIELSTDAALAFNTDKLILATITKHNIFINLAMLIPFGYFNFYLFKCNLCKSVLWGGVCSLLIEFCQFALPINRSPELLDIAFNLISVFIGAVIPYFINLCKKNKALQKIELPYSY